MTCESYDLDCDAPAVTHMTVWDHPDAMGRPYPLPVCLACYRAMS